jgi:uncharacterized protein YjgD (DUF1641 family)
MAQPISMRPAARIAENAPYADAIHSACEVLQLLHERGILELLRGLLGAGDKVVDTLATAIDTPQTIGAMRNFLLLTGFFASIPPDVLNSLLQTAVKGAEQQKIGKAPGFLGLYRRMRSEDARHAMAVMLDLLEGVGRGL